MRRAVVPNYQVKRPNFFRLTGFHLERHAHPGCYGPPE